MGQHFAQVISPCAMLTQTDPDNNVDHFSAQICLCAVGQNVQVISSAMFPHKKVNRV